MIFQKELTQYRTLLHYPLDFRKFHKPPHRQYIARREPRKTEPARASDKKFPISIDIEGESSARGYRARLSTCTRLFARARERADAYLAREREKEDRV